MCHERSRPAFDDFLRFVASRHGPFREESVPSDRLLAAARSARMALLSPHPPDRRARHAHESGAVHVEALELLAASSADTGRPSELTTVRGFRVKLDYRDGTDTEPSSICVLVQCPEQFIKRVQGRVAYLWSGAARFELGEFDIDGKAIGTLPAGIEITLADFATGRVKLEAPGTPADD